MWGMEGPEAAPLPQHRFGPKRAGGNNGEGLDEEATPLVESLPSFFPVRPLLLVKEHLLSTSRTTKGKVLLAAAVLIVAVVAGVVVTSVLGGGTADGNAAAPGSFGNVTQAGLTTAVEGLCGVRSDLQANDLAAARTAFYDKAHLFLHQLAAEVQVKNVDQATSLLVAGRHLCLSR
jgi:hypothetical protein